MADLLLRDLVIATSGRLSLAAMPPRDADLTMLRRSTPVASDVLPGDLFWALPGEADDGMRHVEEAFARGAAGAVISGRAIEAWPGKFTVVVDDVRQALWQTAAHARKRLEGMVIAVAGQNNVASTSEAIHRVLSSQLSGSLIANASNAATYQASDLAALGLLNAHPSHDYIVLTLNSDEAAEMAQRCCPHACVLTGAGDKTSAEHLIRTLEALPETGWAILHGDDADLRNAAAAVMTSTTRAIWYGREPQNDAVNTSVAVTALPAVALAKILNISDLSVSAALGNLPPSDGQLARMPAPLAANWSLSAEAILSNP